MTLKLRRTVASAPPAEVTSEPTSVEQPLDQEQPSPKRKPWAKFFSLLLLAILTAVIAFPILGIIGGIAFY